MPAEALLWILLPVFVSAGTALLCYSIMQAKLEVAVAREREALAEVRAVLNASKATMEEKIRATEEKAARKAMDQFLADLRVEERHYVRESKSLFVSKKAMVLQERLYFRNIPLSNWVEHEMVVEEGGNMNHLAKAASIFSARPLEGPSNGAGDLRMLSGRAT
jgi:flagellar biosynthesis regulator FlaF